MGNTSAIQIKNLSDKTAYEEILNRLNKLSPDSQRQWGKMNVSQMLAHCKEAYKTALTDKPMPRLFLGRMMGWMFKHKLHDDVPWKQGLPTSFRITDERNFDKEKKELISLIDEFYKRGPENIGKYPHPMFGKYTPEQWGKAMWKHLDHHLRQFGV